MVKTGQVLMFAQSFGKELYSTLDRHNIWTAQGGGGSFQPEGAA